MRISKIIIIILTCIVSTFSILQAKALKYIYPGQGTNLTHDKVIQKNLDYVKDIGFEYVRTGIPWDTVEKVKGTYDWKTFDTVVNNIKSNGLRPLIVIGYNNKLYGAAGTFYGISTDEQREGLTKFAVAAVKRHKGKAIIWEIWNEPSISPFWKPQPVYSDYVKMANSVATAMRAAAPGETIVAPGIPVGGSTEFLTAAGKGGLFDKIDGISYHFYASNSWPPESINIPRYCNEIIGKIVSTYRSDHAVLPVVASEQGYSSTAKGMDEVKQGQYITRQMVLQKANCPVISIWHNLYQSSTSSTPEYNYGLIRQDYSLKPSYTAVKTVVRELKGMRFVKAWPLASKDDYAYEFTNGAWRILCIWTRSTPHYVTINNKSQYLTNDVKVLRKF